MVATLLKLVRKHTLVVLLLIALAARLYKVTNPIGDWHAFRQADTASVTREYVKYGIDLLQPRYHDLANIQSGEDNLEGYRMVELPFNNALTAVLVQVIPGDNLVLISRLVSIAWSLVALAALYYLVRDISGKSVAFFSALTFAVLPYIVYYSRAILPEPPTVALLLLSLLGFYRWIKEGDWRWWLVNTIALSLAMLLKPFVVFLAPVYLALLILYHQKGTLFSIKTGLGLSIMAGLVVGPFLWWRTWIEQFPSGIPANDWLWNGNNIRLRPAWFRWIFWERFTKLIFGFLGTAVAVTNVFNWKKDIWVYGSWWLGMLVYLVVVATGNVQHDYYQFILSPILAISFGRGLVSANEVLKRWLPAITRYTLLTVVSILSWYFAWQQVGGYYNINHWEYVRAGAAVDRLLPVDAKVIAPAFGDTQFLFQTNRTGWPIGFEIEKKIELGAEYYVSTSLDDEARELMEKYQVIEQTPEYIIINLQQQTNPTPES